MLIRPDKPDLKYASHLFIDNWHVSREENLTRTLHQPGKCAANPFLRPDMPWECPTMALHGSVIYDDEEGLFKIWYYGAHNVCYATSRDGLEWERPELGICKFLFHDPATLSSHAHIPCWDPAAHDKHLNKTDNNIVLNTQPIPGDPTGLDSPTVFKDLTEPDPARRYKLSVWINPIGQFLDDPAANYKYRMEESKPGAGRYLFYSPDGMHFTLADVPPYLYVQHGIGDRSPIMYDVQKKRYIALWKMGRAAPQAYVSRAQRIRGWSESDDMRSWSDPVRILWPDSFDKDDADFYSMTGFNYGDMYLGLLEVFHRSPDKQNLDVQLLSSHDGFEWDRAADRKVFLPLGGPGEWDRCNHSIASSPPIERDGELWFYYSGRGYKHGAHVVDKEHSSGIGLATLRKDGFVSVDAGDTEGRLVTKPIEITGANLFVNADVAPNGYVVVAAYEKTSADRPPKTRPAERALAGFEPESCRRVQGDSLQHAVTWSNSALDQLVGQTVFLEFRLKSARLYAFRFGPQ